MTRRFRHILPTALVVAMADVLAPTVAAQTPVPPVVRSGSALMGGVGFGTLWDDETFLGRGITLNGGVTLPIGRHLSAEGELAWGRRHRDSGYLMADSAPLTATGRLAFAFLRPSSMVRPFVSAGLTWTHANVRFTSRHLVMGPNGLPVEGPSEQSDWRISLGGTELGVGVEIGGSRRVTWRPEVRVMMTASDPSFTAGHLEPPILAIRGGVAVAWRR